MLARTNYEGRTTLGEPIAATYRPTPCGTRGSRLSLNLFCEQSHGSPAFAGSNRLGAALGGTSGGASGSGHRGVSGRRTVGGSIRRHSPADGLLRLYSENVQCKRGALQRKLCARCRFAACYAAPSINCLSAANYRGIFRASRSPRAAGPISSETHRHQLRWPRLRPTSAACFTCRTAGNVAARDGDGHEAFGCLIG